MKKVYLRSKQARQVVTGLVVNKRVNLKRGYIRSLRAMLHDWRANDYSTAEQRYLSFYDPYGRKSQFRAVVRGRLAYLRDIRGVDDRIFRRLYDRARSIEPRNFPPLPPIADRADSLLEAAEEFPAIIKADTVPLRRQYLRRMFASSEGCVWIVDPHLKYETAEDLQSAVSASTCKVTEVRLLSKEGVNLPNKDIAAFAGIAANLQQAGIRCEWRRLKGDEFHDRWLADDKTCIAMGGPFANIHHPNPPFGQNRQVRRPSQFESWWSKATSI